MASSTRLAAVAGLGAVVSGLVVLAIVAPFSSGARWTSTVIGPGMMGGSGGGMMNGSYGPANGSGTAAASSPKAVRDRVESWLGSRGFTGFRVREVMAFANDDYVAVRDAKGKPAFELLVARNLSWLMEEPPSAMWNSRYGMMRGISRNWSGMGSMMGRSYGGWNGRHASGSDPVGSVAAAVGVGDRWLSQSRPGERVDPDVGGMGAFPGYFTLDTVRDGKTVGMISVNATSGAVWYHGWHGRFLGEHEF